MNRHFLQSEAWLDFQKSIGKQVITVDEFHAIGFIEGNKPFQRLFFPYGPSVSNEGDLKKFLSLVKARAEKLNLTYLRIEPILNSGAVIKESYLEGLKFRKTKDIQPQFTMIVDLTPEPDQIIANMSQSNRNLHRNIHKKGVRFSESENYKDMIKLIDMLKIVAARTGMRPHPNEYLLQQAKSLMGSNKAKLFFAHDSNNNIIAGTLIYTGQKTWYYSHSAGLDEARKLQVMGPLLSFIMLEAKKNGAEEFDLFGVSNPEETNHQLANITKFKQSFGGRILARSGTWDLPINKIKYYIYKLLIKLRH
jgi:lipid II:glycine glycyltransferase (peptidoglycan interpeptide bridge formation enzyme)